MESYVLARRKCKALSELWWAAIHRGPPHEGEKGKAVWRATERKWSQGAGTNDCNTWNQVVDYICLFSFSISLFTNDLCFNIWHSKTSAMPSCGGISLLCWELKFHFWNFSLLDLWRTLSSDIALWGFCALLLEEKKITKQKHVHFHLLRAGSGGSLTEAMLGCEVSEQGTWSGITMSIADSNFLTNQGRINCRNSEMKYIIHLQTETLSPLEIMGTIGLPKCGYLGAFGSLKEGIQAIILFISIQLFWM